MICPFWHRSACLHALKKKNSWQRICTCSALGQDRSSQNPTKPQLWDREAEPTKCKCLDSQFQADWRPRDGEAKVFKFNPQWKCWKVPQLSSRRSLNHLVKHPSCAAVSKWLEENLDHSLNIDPKKSKKKMSALWHRDTVTPLPASAQSQVPAIKLAPMPCKTPRIGGSQRRV